MMTDDRDAPQSASENFTQSGDLRIFLSYADGIGKTTAMLQAGLQRQQEGADVLCGWVESPTSNHQQEILGRLESIELSGRYNAGQSPSKLDLAAIIQRQPDFVLIDDLAHTNQPPAQHAHRYQDIEELLDQGIDVYTTLNVQHLESLNDIVEEITGISVQATIPDRIFYRAAHVELVDMAPDELLERIRQLDIPESEKGLYEPGNLHALRQLALRQIAQHVDRQMRRHMATKAIAGPWAASERLLVCISSNPLSARLVRTGYRLAHELSAAWFVVYVDQSAGQELAPPHQKQLYETMKLAERLGAQVDRVTGSDIATALLDFARQQNITKIIIGQPLRTRWQELINGSIVNRLIRYSGHIDVYVINSGAQQPLRKPLRIHRLNIDLRNYLQAGLIVILTTIIAFTVHAVFDFDPTNLVMLYLLAVVVVALRFGYGPSIITAAVSVLIFNFSFVPPRFTMQVSDAQYLLTFLGLFSAGVVIASLTSRAHRQTQAARQREYETAQLLLLTRELSTTVDTEEIAHRIVQHIRQAFEHEVGLYLERNGELQLSSQSERFNREMIDESTLQWVLKHRQPAGTGTDTRSDSTIYYVPMLTAQHSLGVLAVLLHQPLPVSGQHLLDASATQAALALEAAQLGEAAQQARLFQEKERLQSVLLNSISHDLRTPLVSITGALSSLLEKNTRLDFPAQQALLSDALSEAERLNHLVGNLLDISRLESGAMKLRREPYDLSEVIGVARTHLRNRSKRREFVIHLPDDLPLMNVDIALFAQVFINLFDNALKYSDDDQPIEINARRRDHSVEIMIGDRGVGIPEDELPFVFDKFYRARNVDGRGGSGLGLTICQGIVEAHGGTLTVQNRPEGGTWFIINMPLEESTETL